MLPVWKIILFEINCLFVVATQSDTTSYECHIVQVQLGQQMKKLLHYKILPEHLWAPSFSSGTSDSLIYLFLPLPSLTGHLSLSVSGSHIILKLIDLPCFFILAFSLKRINLPTMFEFILTVNYLIFSEQKASRLASMTVSMHWVLFLQSVAMLHMKDNFFVDIRSKT